MAVSRARLIHNADENTHTVGGKAVSRKDERVTVRGILGEVNANSACQQANITSANAQKENDKKKILKPVLRRNYFHVQSKIDTGLPTRTIQPSARRPLRREESTGVLASRAALQTKVATKELRNDKENQKENIKDNQKEKIKVNQKENVKEAKKPVRVNSFKGTKEKKTIKDTADSLKQLKLTENSKCITYNEETPVLPADVEDIDADEHSPLLMSIYIKDIYRYLTHLETLYPISENYLKNQNVVTGNMRATLVNWLVEIQGQFNLLAETFQLAIGIIDRYLQVLPNLPKEYLQLVGVTATLIASKYEEIYHPSIDDFEFIADNTYTKSEIKKCEIEILKKLDFCMSRPIPISFLRRYVKVAHGSSKNHHLAKYFVDLCLVEYSMVHYRPSELAAAAICLSLHLLSGKPLDEIWTPSLVYYSEYNLAHIKPIIIKIAKIVYNVDKSKHRAVHKKYTHVSLAKVSTLPQLKGPATYDLAVRNHDL